ncbi:MAG: NosD domain-containing protein, partial [Gemmatimonadaceae bacterium]
MMSILKCRAQILRASSRGVVAVAVVSATATLLSAQRPATPLSKLSSTAPPTTIVPKAGLVITRSVRIKPGVYALPAKASTDSALITIRGNNITVDFTGVELRGTSISANPDEATGIALLIDGGTNIRVRGLRARGYRFGILARDTHGLSLDANDLSNSWKPRLFSVVEHESLVDWLSFHHNEQHEWMRFGAGIYLDSVRGGVIRNNVIQQSMNGLMMTSTDSLRVVENNFSFNSGLGIGMYRSTYNVVTGNRVDY